MLSQPRGLPHLVGTLRPYFILFFETSQQYSSPLMSLGPQSIDKGLSARSFRIGAFTEYTGVVKLAIYYLVYFLMTNRAYEKMEVAAVLETGH